MSLGGVDSLTEAALTLNRSQVVGSLGSFPAGQFVCFVVVFIFTLQTTTIDP